LYIDEFSELTFFPKLQI